MSAYRVKIDIYDGPLDLLLYLIRRDELDIHDIPIARITEQYLEYVELIHTIDIDLAGEFLVMAATLMEIKSAMLLPRTAAEDDDADALDDPRLELVRQLLAYKQFKDISGHLADSAQERAKRFGRPDVDVRRVRKHARAEQELDVESVQIWDLLSAFNRLMAATLASQRGHAVIHDDTPIDVYEVDILAQVQQAGGMSFSQIFKTRQSRSEMVGLFLALLELTRQKLVRLEQARYDEDIAIFPLTDEPAETAVARAVRDDIQSLPSALNRDQKHRKAQGISADDDSQSSAPVMEGFDDESHD